ncbi:hypothetical protein D0T53_13080 [Dysgonomonas sp. 216]|uniref:phBC6A51 family helix-turn-helix protein n=1 Tax=Dysgonomonas sp. 216 TaxID=2302934 RepID=UPI0013D3B34F|nr:phBC6A51 family helix-turn-helix protein [Dysgonomonas sp. 216]NDW19833.1 hypothetical protein [Dysgonomonas sp. 216]
MAKYTPETVEKICILISEDYLSIANVCDAAEISRETFYEWKKNKPEFAQAVEEAIEERQERLYRLARNAMRRKMEGYTQKIVKKKYVPSALDPEEMELKEIIVTEKHCEPKASDIAHILKMEREERREKAEKEEKENSPSRRPIIVEVVDKETKWEMEQLPRRLNDPNYVYQPMPDDYEG